MTHVKKEKRQYPRINNNLPIKVAANGYDFSTSTQNISCVGAYCNIKKYIPPFTKVLVKLSLPLGSKVPNKKCLVDCKGVIVRTDDAQKDGFNIAIFFNNITDSQKKRISTYISQFLPNNY